MNRIVMYKLLYLVNKKISISALLKLGYSYSSIINWYTELEQRGYIYTDEDTSKFITAQGSAKLKELEKEVKNNHIRKLEQYRIPKMKLEEIYLP